MRFTLLFLIAFNAIGQTQDLRFIQNKGQWNNQTDFNAKVPGGRVGVSAKGFSVLLLDMAEMERRHLASHEAVNESDGHPADEPINGHYFQINFLGSNPQSRPIKGAPFDGHYSYFLGNNPDHWASNVLAYTSILYPNIYEGIDFQVSSVGKNLKYDFIVKPGADPSQIRIEYDGVTNIEKIDDELSITTALGTLHELKPFSYQGNFNQPVASAFRIHNNVVTFSFPEGYDNSRTLTIDPLLIFSTYSGSTADNWGSTATPGEHGTLYSAGVTRTDEGGSFPATTGAFQTHNNGEFDMAIIKYDSAGTKFLYATYLGGGNNDSPESLVVDKATGDLIVLGISSSVDYPTTATAYDGSFNFGTLIFNRVIDTEDMWDIVITRLTPNGNKLVGSTYLGGADNDGLNRPKQSGGPLVVNYGDEMRGDVITDNVGNIYISSVTASTDFPIVNGFNSSFNNGVSNGIETDGIVVKLNPDLSSIIWSTYIGGSGFDASYSIKFDGNDNIVLAGGTTSSDFPVTAGAYQTVFNGIVDGWIARITADGSAVMNATFTGTNSFDQVYFTDLNANGNIYSYGQTTGHMPVTAGVFNIKNSGQFVQKFSPDLSTLVFSTVFGSGTTNGLIRPNISPTAFLVNDCDNIYMTGWGGDVNSSPVTGYWETSTFGMPITSDAFQSTTSGSDFYFIVLNGDATELVYSTYMGGTISKTHVDGGTSRFDKFGIVYHAVCSGCAFESPGPASDFPTTPNAKSRFNLSSNCNNAAFKFDLSSLSADFDTNNLALTIPGYNNVCYPEPIVFQNLSTGGRLITWNFDDGSIVNKTNKDSRNVVHKYSHEGQYHVKLKITDLSTCSQTDSITKVINYFKDHIVVGNDGVVCDGKSFMLTATGGVTYNWTSNDGTFSSTDQNPSVEPTTPTTYYVTVVDGNGCSKSDTVNVSIMQYVHAAFQTYDLNFTKSDYNDVCYPNPIRFKNRSINGVDYTWNFDDGSTLNSKNDTLSIMHTFFQGDYKVKLKAINLNTCNKADSVVKTIHYFKSQAMAGGDVEVCEGTEVLVYATGGNTYTWTSDDHSFNSSIAASLVRPSKTTLYIVTATDTKHCMTTDTMKVSVIENVDVKWRYDIGVNCVDYPSILVENLTTPEDSVTFHFDFGDGTTSQEMKVEHLYKKDGIYTLKFITQKKFCFYEKTVQVPSYKLFIPNVITPEGSSGYNDYFQVVLDSDPVHPIPVSDIGLKIHLAVVNRWGDLVFETQDYKNDWNGHGLNSGVYFFELTVGKQTCKNWLQILK